MLAIYRAVDYLLAMLASRGKFRMERSQGCAGFRRRISVINVLTNVYQTSNDAINELLQL